MTAELPPIPPGPADTIYPRRALARLALSYAYYEAADFAAGGVPTVSDEYGDPYDYVDHAARLLSIAQDVLTRAVVYARERGGSWTDIAEALGITDQQARTEVTDAKRGAYATRKTTLLAKYNSENGTTSTGANE